MRMRSLRSIRPLLALLCCLFGMPALGAPDLFTATDKLATTVAPRLTGKRVLLGPIANEETGLVDGLTRIVQQELHTRLANMGVSSRVSLNQESILSRLQDVGSDVTRLRDDGFPELQSSDVIVLGSVGRWGSNAYVVRLQVFDLATRELIGGASEYLERSSIPQEIAREAFGMANLPEAVTVGGELAAYEARAIGGSYGYLPVEGGITYIGGTFEHKITKHSSIGLSIGKLNFSSENVWKKRESEVTLFSVDFRSYPFYKGRGLRGFFFGAGLLVGLYEESEWRRIFNGDQDLWIPQNSDSSVLGVNGLLGIKAGLGPSIYLEPYMRLYAAVVEDELQIGGWVGVSLGFMW